MAQTGDPTGTGGLFINGFSWVNASACIFEHNTAELQGGGWYIEEYGRAQISFNIMAFRTAPRHEGCDA